VGSWGKFDGKLNEFGNIDDRNSTRTLEIEIRFQHSSKDSSDSSLSFPPSSLAQNILWEKREEIKNGFMKRKKLF
jgi:hypothetical protein